MKPLWTLLKVVIAIAIAIPLFIIVLATTLGVLGALFGLAILALKETNSEGISNLFKGQTCVAYSSDPMVAARIAVKYSRENDKLVILGGAMGSNILDSTSVKALADLPSLDELRAKLIGLLNAPATKIARTIKEPGAKLARVIQAQASKGEAA